MSRPSGRTNYDLKRGFCICEDIELRHAKLYANLSLILGELDECAAVFWESMSTEEWQHYVMVDFGRLICEVLVRNENRICMEELNLKDGFEIAIELEGAESDDLYLYLTSVIKQVVYEKNSHIC